MKSVRKKKNSRNDGIEKLRKYVRLKVYKKINDLDMILNVNNER
jgi:hypothetical protein